MLAQDNSTKIMIHAFLTLYVSVRIILTQTVVCPESTNLFQSDCFTDCNITTIRSESDNTIGQGIDKLYYVAVGVSACTQHCSSQCQTCETYSDNCMSCPQTDHLNFLLLSKCYFVCPQLYYQNYTALTCDSCANSNKGCNNCSINKECTQYGGSYDCSQRQSWICLTCDSGDVMLYQVLTNFTSCLSEAPDGYVDILGVATICNSRCLTCSQFVWNCTYCSTLIFYNSQCVEECPISHFNKTISISFNSLIVQTQICTLCLPPCRTCIAQAECLSCVAGRYFSPLTLECVTSNSCPITTYPNNTNYQCQPCVDPCRRCLNHNQCQQCSQGYLYEGGCPVQCPIRTYQAQIGDLMSQDNITMVCQNCVGLCKQCANASACLSCINSSVVYYFSSNLSCLYGCPDQYFQEKITMTCQHCPQYCETCDEVSCFSCTKINSTEVYYLWQGQCLIQCPSSLFASFSTTLICQSCPNQCKKCQNLTFCTQCIEDYFLIENGNFSGMCQSSCPSPYNVQAKNSQNQLICVLCSDYLCERCNAKDYCQNCINSYNNSSTGQIQDAIALFKGRCYLNCEVPYEKIKNSLGSGWTCQLPVQYVNTTQDTPLVKGIILTNFIPFLGSYVTVGITISVLIIFMIIRCNQTQKGLFFVMLSAVASLPESYVVIVMGYSHFMYHLYQFIERFDYNILSVILFGCFLCYLLLNIINVYLFVKVSSQDKSFKEWKKHNSICSSIVFILTNSFSLINFKFHNILWSKFGSLPVLQQISKLNYYNAICGIGIFPTLGILICSGFCYIQEQQIKNIYLDAIIVLTFQTIILLISLKRPKDLFIFHLKQVSDESLSNSKRQLHRRIVQSDQIIGTAIKPSGLQINQQYLNKKISQDMNTQLLTSNWDKYLTQCQKSSCNYQSERMFLQGTLSKRQKNKSLQKRKSQVIFDMNNSRNGLFYPNNSLNQSLVSFQSSDDFKNLQDNQNLFINKSKNIHKSNLKQTEFEDVKFKENIMSKSQFIARNRINFSQQSNSQVSDILNDAMNSIQQGTDRGQQGSIWQSQEQVKQPELLLQTRQKSIKIQFNLKNQSKIQKQFVHNQKLNELSQIQIESFEQIKILDLLDSDSKSENISDKAVFQQSFFDQSNIHKEQNQQFIIDQQQYGQLQVSEHKNKTIIIAPKEQQNKYQNQMESQEQINQQYFGGYSIDNSMGSIRNRYDQDQGHQCQSKNQSQSQNYDQIKSTNKQNFKQVGTNLKQKFDKLKDKFNKQQNQKEVQNFQQKIKNQFVKKQEQHKNKKRNQIENNQQINNEQDRGKQDKIISSIKNQNQSLSVINSKEAQLKQQEVGSDLKSNKTVQISQDQLQKEELDILPLVFNEGNYEHSQSSIIYKQTQNQYNQVSYAYNDFTVEKKQNFLPCQKYISSQRQLQERNQQASNNFDNSPQKINQDDQIPGFKQNQKDRNQEYIQFRIKTTLKQNKGKDIKNSNQPRDKKQKQQVLVIEDKKFKKLKRQLRQLEKQENKHKALIQNIDQFFESQKVTYNRQTRINQIQHHSKLKDRNSLSRQTKNIQAPKSHQKHNRNNSKQKIDRKREIQKIYSNTDLISNKKKQKDKNQLKAQYVQTQQKKQEDS